MKSLYIFPILLFLGGSLFAQETGGRSEKPATTVETTVETKTEVRVERILPPAEQRAEMVTDRMKAQLDLSDEQLKKVKLINLNSAYKMDAIRKQYKADPEKILEKGKEVDKEHDEKMVEILSPAQWSKYRYGK